MPTVGSTACVLFVDDEVGVLRSLKRLCRGQPYRVLTAATVEEGMELLSANEIQLVVSDQRMPGHLGTDFLREICHRYPLVVRCILSGYAEMHSIVSAINDGQVYRFVSKPWSDADLLGVIDESLALYARNKSKADDLAKLRSKQAVHEAQLKLQTTLLDSAREMLDELPVPVAVLDLGGTMVFANEQFVSELGASSDLGLGQVVSGSLFDVVQEVCQLPVGSRVARFVDVREERYVAHFRRAPIGQIDHMLVTLTSLMTGLTRRSA